MTITCNTQKSYDEMYMEQAVYLPAIHVFEYELYDGEALVYFTLVGVDIHRREITLTVASCGKISRRTFDLSMDDQGFFFVYGPDETKIYFTREEVRI